MLLKASLVISEGMAGNTEASCLIDLIDEILRRDPFLRKAIDPECGNIAPERIILYAYKNRKANFSGICLRTFL